MLCSLSRCVPWCEIRKYVSMWYNFDVLKKQHCFMEKVKECHVCYVPVEHASGVILLSAKIGVKYCDFYGGSCREILQASYLTMRITFKNIRNALPGTKCCRENYALNGTSFVIHDKRYANIVLSDLFEDYDGGIEMKKYILNMFDDWESLYRIVSSAYPICEDVIVGNVVKEESGIFGYFRRLFSCGSVRMWIKGV